MLIIIVVGVYILYRKNKAKFIGIPFGEKFEKLVVYAFYVFLGCLAFAICSIVVQKIFK